jgi:hypothetical protein
MHHLPFWQSPVIMAASPCHFGSQLWHGICYARASIVNRVRFIRGLCRPGLATARLAMSAQQIINR